MERGREDWREEEREKGRQREKGREKERGKEGEEGNKLNNDLLTCQIVEVDT